MNQTSQNKQILNELYFLRDHQIINENQFNLLCDRYPSSQWNLIILIRWFTILGVLSFLGGMILLLSDHLMLFLSKINLEHLILGVLIFFFLIFTISGRYLTIKGRYTKSGASLELLGMLSLECTFFSLGNMSNKYILDDWPSYLGVSTIVLTAFSYFFKNRLILIASCVNFFIWFGGSTGYMSGWGAYWIGMNYPLRFLFAGLLIWALGYIHYKDYSPLLERFRPFCRVYFHFSLLIIHLAFWFLSLFGNYEWDVRFSDSLGERILFTFLWFLVALMSIYLGTRKNYRVAKSYGLVFAIINIYTAYAQFVIYYTSGVSFLHFLVIGSTLLAIGIKYEKILSSIENKIGS
ncbi:MAG: hypothetical protein H6622_01405 [Halobacteriovoraceae bacterium]|nr:hypothetical protein [Halobacteriovoraceae bacterium]